MNPHPDRQAFLESVAERNVAAARLGSLLVAVLMPAGCVLDWFTNPEHLRSFLLLRFGATALALGILPLTFRKGAARHAFVLGLFAPLVAALSIGVMIARLGGYASPYYAGLNLIILGMGFGFIWTVRQTLLATGLVLAIWLVPALLQFPEVELGPFVNNLYFLTLTSVIAVAGNDLRHRQALREFEARQEVARTSERLAEALSRLREADRQKNEFFANVSHELRTPLALILSPVEERLARGVAESERGLFEVIRRNAARLLRLIDDLLDLSRIDAGRLRLQIGTLDLRLLVDQVVEAFGPAAAAKEIAIDLDLSPVADVWGDPHRIEIILTNLLGNALKFTPPRGRIRLRLALVEGQAQIEVSDNGPGIPEAERERIFDRFYQVEGSARRSKGGAGIGLALARELAELHGGSLTVASTVGTGSTFVLRLPLGRDHFRPEVIERRKVSIAVPQGRRASDRADVESTAESELPLPSVPSVAAAAEPVRFEGNRRPRILLAEDNPDIRAFLRELLATDHEVLVATDGASALELARKERPDLVISDVMMPQLTGTDLCAALKADPLLRNTPVVLLTARTGSDAVLEGYSSGADDFVTKPIHPRILLARVRAQLRLRFMGLQLAQQERLAAVGTLAAGVGHEVRNPVNAILNGARALLANPGLDPDARRVLEVVEEAAQRIERISGALLDHASPAEQDRPRPCDLRAGIEATLRLLEHRNRRVRVHRDYGTNRAVLASAAELNQVFLNLLDNALQSSAANIWIRIEDRQDRVVVSVEDDGPGVPAEIADRIFDPFFTTRGPGEGTGLGLYLSRKIVHRYGGELRLNPRPGGGASFAVELPAETRP